MILSVTRVLHTAQCRGSMPSCFQAACRAHTELGMPGPWLPGQRVRKQHNTYLVGSCCAGWIDVEHVFDSL